MRGNPERRAQIGVCFVGVHAIALGVAVVGTLGGSSVLPFALIAYASLPWWLLGDVAVSSWLGADSLLTTLIGFAVLNLVLHAGLWWWAWRRAWRAWHAHAGGGRLDPSRRSGYDPTMTQTPDDQGRLDDEALEQQTSDDEGAAAAGEYDPAQGSPGQAHPVGEDFPDEAVTYDDPEDRPRS